MPLFENILLEMILLFWCSSRFLAFHSRAELVFYFWEILWFYRYVHDIFCMSALFERKERYIRRGKQATKPEDKWYGGDFSRNAPQKPSAIQVVKLYIDFPTKWLCALSFRYNGTASIWASRLFQRWQRPTRSTYINPKALCQRDRFSQFICRHNSCVCYWSLSVWPAVFWRGASTRVLEWSERWHNIQQIWAIRKLFIAL